MSRPVRERDVLLVTAVCHFLSHFTMLVFPSLALVMADDLGLPFDRVLGLSLGMYMLYGLGALPAGVITDAWGRPRAMLVICLLGMAGCLAWVSRAPGPREIGTALAGVGLFASIYHPAGMAWISRDIRRRGWGLGINGVFGNLGVIAAPFAAGALAVTVGWRTAYLLLAIPALVAAAVAFTMGRGEPAPPAQRPATGGGRRRTAVSFGVLAVAMMLGGLAYRGQTLVLPAWFQQRLGSLMSVIDGWTWLPESGGTLMAATTLTSLAYLAGAAGQAWGGRLADRYDLRRVYLAFHFVTIPALILMGRLDGPPLLAAALVYAFFAFGMQPAENSLVAALTPPRLRSTGYGLKFVMVFGVGSLAVRLVEGWQRSDGLGAVFAHLAGFEVGLVAAVLALMFVSRGISLRN